MYLNTGEIITKLEILSLQYPDLCQTFTLNTQTHESRDVWAIKIETAENRPKHGVLIIAGVHAREWGHADIVIHFLETYLAAYQNGTGIQYGNQAFSAADIHSSLDSIRLFIVPCINPDGREYSFSDGIDEQGHARNSWRKNRRDNGNPSCWGVDLNRNFDWLWDIQTTIHPQAQMDSPYYNYCQGYINASYDPCTIVYHGPHAFSEPEVRNIRDLLNSNPGIRIFVDVHGTRGIILTPWGDDELQSTDPEMNFLNPAYDGLRGLADEVSNVWGCTGEVPNPDGAAYKEYMHPIDQNRYQLMGVLQVSAINAVRGEHYRTEPGFTGLYGITGGTKDYGFGRHMQDPSRRKIDTFLYEYGIGTGFQPPYEDPPGPNDMIHVIRDCAAGLTALCVNADRIPIVTCSPNTLEFGLIRAGTTKRLYIDFRNTGPRAISIDSVSVLGTSPGPYSATMPSTTSLAAGELVHIPVRSSPTSSGEFKGRIAIEFSYPDETIHDVHITICNTEACSVSSSACIAPVFQKQNIIVCLLLFITIPLIIAALAIFAWIPGVMCTIKQLFFMLSHLCGGNSDPCIILMKNRWGRR